KGYSSRTRNERFDALSGFDRFKGFLGFLKFNDVRDQFLDAYFASSDQVNGKFVITTAISKAAFHGQFLSTGSHNRKSDLVLTHASLDVSAASSEGMDTGMHRRLSTRSVNHDIGTRA